MTDETLYLGLDELLAIHERMVQVYGGDASVRDQGLLQSAAAMPRAAFGGEDLHPDLPSKAAAYLFHICRNHPFTDGNKRTALAAAELFIRANGCHLAATNHEVEDLTLRVARGELDKQAVIAFFQDRVRSSTDLD